MIVVVVLFGLMMPLLVASSSMAIWEYGTVDKPTKNEERIKNAQIVFLVTGLIAFFAAIAYIGITNSPQYKAKQAARLAAAALSL